MPNTNEFFDALKTTASARRSDPAAGAIKVLEEFCAGVERFTKKKARCQLRRGFSTNLGQEWRIILHSSAGGPDQLLFRAHVPPGGYPVRLDLYEDRLTECIDEAALRAQLKRALALPAVQDAITNFSR